MIVRGVEPFAWFYREAFVPDFITCVAYGLLHIIAPLLQMDRFMISPISLVHQYHLIEQVFEGRAQILVDPISVTLDVVEESGGPDGVSPVGPWYETRLMQVEAVQGGPPTREDKLSLHLHFLEGLLLDSLAWRRIIDATRNAVALRSRVLRGGRSHAAAFLQVWRGLTVSAERGLETYRYDDPVHHYEFYIGPLLVGMGNLESSVKNTFWPLWTQLT